MHSVRIVKSSRKSISLQVTPSGEVIARAPKFMPDILIKAFVKKQERWIEAHLKKVSLYPKRISHTYSTGDEFWYLGERISLTIGPYKKIEVRSGKLYFPEILLFRIKRELTDFYIKKARDIITNEVEDFTHKMHTTYKDISFSDTKSQWGRCTHDNRLQFSWKLVMSPLLTIRYVVIHELAHTLEKNHSRAFWSKVRQFIPSYRQQIKWLKENGRSLTV
ncbi:MAG: M48 family metallopeptidase [Candidatus Levybacteria bacterium]|nr:M48 family metallopeptidase [Candidatus Levybacteria bacterium]